MPGPVEAAATWAHGVLRAEFPHISVLPTPVPDTGVTAGYIAVGMPEVETTETTTVTVPVRLVADGTDPASFTRLYQLVDSARAALRRAGAYNLFGPVELVDPDTINAIPAYLLTLQVALTVEDC